MSIGESRKIAGLALYNFPVFPYNQAMSTTAPNQSHLTRGYSIALASAAILSTTSIFIRHLTQTYALPALVLVFWRDVFVTLTLLLVLGLLRLPLPARPNRWPRAAFCPARRNHPSDPMFRNPTKI